MPSGRWSLSRLMSIDVKPNTALVTCPDAVAVSVGRAKKARYANELPSRSINFATQPRVGLAPYHGGVTTEIHPPVEEYLEAIHELEEEGIHVIQARLAERLGHSPPSVSEMIH